MVRADYHVHTGYCPHAEGAIKDYIEKAIKLGIRELGFCDHLPIVKKFQDGYTMKDEQLKRYVDEIFTLRNVYKDDIIIKLGIEADYMPVMQDRVSGMLSEYPFDFVCGSVHFIDDWAFDMDDAKNYWAKADVCTVYSKYIKLLIEATESGIFDFLGHIDLVKKFGYRPESFMADEWDELALSVRKHDMAIEINSSGLRKEVGEIYPSADILNIFKKHDVPIVFGSDAHSPDDVGKDFDKSYELAKEAGYKQAVIFTERVKSEVYDI